MNGAADYLRAFETPRFACLSPNLYAASFSLMKLLPARYMVDRAAASGRLERGGHIIETTSGTFGLAMAMVCAIRQYQLTLVTASTLTEPRFTRRLEQLGAKQVIIEDPVGDGNQSGRLEHLREMLHGHESAYWPRQYDCADNRLAYSRLADLAIRSFGQIDCLVGCVGTGGSLCGTGQFLRNLFPDLSILAVDTHRSVLFGHPAGKRMLRGLGNSILPENVLHQLIDEVHWVGALPAYAMAHALVREHALFVGPSSGAAALVASWYAKRNPDAKTLVIMADEGHRYQDTIHNNIWLASLPGWPCQIPSEPVRLDRIAPAEETAWTTYPWGRRALNEIVQS
ncbi:cystathionine beta-synthase [Labrys miyagiensis]|uniref:Cystathionine beta-synthase n=1 Tax=Labrys miyagiensis TaxID=346912 RepID=A0ABQ6CCP6_9HYPH|nr:PLP-dependent cysteine synthase family protein [Labrys miyagiensis]GLS18058.1 cystathionine beta-synthase [Labrys miyagiensis]